MVVVGLVVVHGRVGWSEGVVFVSFILGATASLKIVASWVRARSVEAFIGLNGVAGDGFWRAVMMSDAACCIISRDDVFGMGTRDGRDYTVSTIRNLLGLGM